MSQSCAPPVCRSSIFGNRDAYKDKLTSLSLYKGIVIGVAGLLALFLTIVFVVKGAGDISRRRGAGLGGAGLRLHRLRFLGQDFRHVGAGRSNLARRR